MLCKESDFCWRVNRIIGERHLELLVGLGAVLTCFRVNDGFFSCDSKINK